VQERLNWRHWKCRVPQKGTVGSNPTLSAIMASQKDESDADFISKIEDSLQELEEILYWLELLEEVNLFNSEN
jgi:hypothetical protein